MSDHIPFEIQEQIIEKLPPKSLIKFRSVSKSWKSLIDSSKFIADYNVCEATKQFLFICYCDDGSDRFISIADDDSFPQHKFVPPLPVPVNSPENFGLKQVVGSSHGLICFYGTAHYSAIMMAVIWNPSIRRSVGVHVPGLYGKPFETFIGFGVCPRTLDPKIIKIPHDIPLAGMGGRIRIHLKELKVFSLSSGRWRRPNGNLPRSSIGFQEDSEQVVTDGFIYWLALGAKDDYLIISLDLTSEEFGEVRLPRGLAKKNLSISKLRESLAVVEYNTDRQSNQLAAIWVMGSGVLKLFTKLHTVAGVSIERLYGCRNSGTFIIERQADCDDQSSSEIALYEPESKQIIKTGIVGESNSFSVHSYMETLLLLDQPNGFIHKDRNHVIYQWRGGPKKRRRSSKF